MKAGSELHSGRLWAPFAEGQRGVKQLLALIPRGPAGDQAGKRGSRGPARLAPRGRGLTGTSPQTDNSAPASESTGGRLRG